MLEQHGTGVSEFDAMADPMEKRLPQFVFEPAHRCGHGGLHHVLALRTAGEAALVGYRNEVGELAQFHLRSIAYIDGPSENIRWTPPNSAVILE
jgi:hypothetical protein